MYVYVICVCMYVLCTYVHICILYKPLIFLFLLFVSRSLILPVRYYLFLFLHCLLTSYLTFSKLSVLLWFWFCNHWIVACFLWSKNCEHSSWNRGLCFFHSYRPRCSLAEISIFSLTFFRASFISLTSFKVSVAVYLLQDFNQILFPNFASLNFSPILH